MDQGAFMGARTATACEDLERQSMKDNLGFDDRVNFAIEQLLNGDDGWRDVVRGIVHGWPGIAPLEIVFTLVSAASAIEQNFADGSPARDGAAQGYRLAGLLGVDIYAMQTLGMPCAKAQDLLAYWRIDPWFARL
jgi:hypothetical protein